MNDESFGDLTLDSNLHREMDILGGDGDDDDDDDDIVFYNETTPNSSDADSDDDDDVAKATRPPKSFGRLFIWHWDKRKHRIEHEYAICHCGMGAVCP